ncbi:MAG: LamG domain-containing protein, partial [Methylophilaceae bacterium]|nr:LamG domain-containing protein [Methylophilaceae bacterium]
DNLTANPTINVFGLERNSTWQYQVDAGSWQEGTGSSFSALADQHTYRVRQIDAAGNLGVPSAETIYILDTVQIAVILDTSTKLKVTSTYYGRASDYYQGPGNALSLNGSSQFASLPNLTFGGDLTVEMWVNLNSLAEWSRLLDLGSGASNNNIVLTISGGRIYFETYNNNASQGSLTGSVLTTHEWIHVAATISGRNVTLYVNGEVVGQRVLGAAPLTTTRTSNFIGKSNWAGDNFLDGEVRDARIYTNARTQQQILTDMTGQINIADPRLLVAYSFANGGMNSVSVAGAATLQGGATVVQQIYSLDNPVESAIIVMGNNPYVINSDRPLSKVTLRLLWVDSNGDHFNILNGALDGTNERLRVGGTELFANGSVTSGTVTVGANSWSWTWSALLPDDRIWSAFPPAENSAGGKFTFTLNGRTDVSITEAQELIHALSYRNVAANPTRGLRVFEVSVSDTNDAESIPVSSFIDTSSPPYPDLIFAVNSGSSAEDGLSNQPLVSVRDLYPSSTWDYQIDGGSWIRGSWASFSALDGTHTYAVRQTDRLGNVTVDNILFNVDPTALTASAVNLVGLDASSTTGNRIVKTALQVGDVIEVTLTLGGAVTVSGIPSYTINVGGVARVAQYNSTKSNATNLVFDYRLVNGDNADAGGITAPANGFVAGGILFDASHNARNRLTSPLAASNGLTATTTGEDTTPPTVVSMALSGVLPTTYLYAGAVITVTVVMSEAVTVNTDAGTPLIALIAGSNLVFAEYDEGNSTSTNLVFTYTLQGGEVAYNGVGIPDYVPGVRYNNTGMHTSNLFLNGARISDLAGL